MDFDEIDDVFGGGGIDPSAAVAWVNEGMQADLGKCARLTSGKVAKQLADDALGQIVGLDLLIQRELANLRHHRPVAHHPAPQKPLMPEMVETQILAIPMTRTGEQRQVAGCAGCPEAPLHCR